MEGYLRESLDANVLRQSGDSLEFRHPLLREAAYDDLMPDERTRIHGRLAEILQARVDADPDPGVAALSRLAFHWNAAHDLPRTLAASVRAGLAAKRLGAAEAITQLERALSLWDRVPDAEALARQPAPSSSCSWVRRQARTGTRSGAYAGPHGGGHARARPRPEAGQSRVLRVGLPQLLHRGHDRCGRGDPAAFEYAGDSPTEELARAQIAQSQYLYRQCHFAASVEAAQQAIDAARSAGCVEAELDAIHWRSVSLFYLGRIARRTRRTEAGSSPGPDSGHARALDQRIPSGRHYMLVGQVDRCLSVAREGFEEALALGLPVNASLCGGAALNALLWRGRLDEAEQRFEELRELGLPPRAGTGAPCARSSGWHAVTPTRRPRWYARPRQRAGSRRMPEVMDVLTELELAAMLDDRPSALETARSYLAQLHDTDSPLIAAAAARIGFHALCVVRSTPGGRADELRDLSTRQLASARGGLTDEWRPTYHAVQLALAEAYAARYAGEPAVAQFRIATSLAEPFGAYFALEPRLNQAEELLAHGGRDEGRELLVECWSTAHDIGAHYLERRAFRLATRTRVPLPQSASREGPLSRLTPREREVFDLLATGATNKTIATTLFITEKTASVHVSNILAKLDVTNRGEAAAIARQLVG